MTNIIELRKMLVDGTIDLNQIEFSSQQEKRYDYYYQDGKVSTQEREPHSPTDNSKLLIFQLYNNTLYDFDYKLAEQIQDECSEGNTGGYTSPHDHLNSCACSEGSIRTLVTALYAELGRMIDDYFIKHQIDKKIISQPHKPAKYKTKKQELDFEMELQISDELCQVIFDITGPDKTEVEQRMEYFTIIWSDEMDQELEFRGSREFLGHLLYFLNGFRPYTLRNMKYFVLTEVIKISVRKLFEKYSVEKLNKPSSNGFRGGKSGKSKLTPSNRYYYQEINKVKQAILRYLKSVGLSNQAGEMIIRPVQEGIA